jgi:hypothetical protein
LIRGLPYITSAYFWPFWTPSTYIPYQHRYSTERQQKWPFSKGQLISKADWRAVDSPKKRTDEFDLFAVKSKKANKINLPVRFLGESLARQSAFEIN